MTYNNLTQYLLIIIFLWFGYFAQGQEFKNKHQKREISFPKMACSVNAVDNGDFQFFSTLPFQNCNNATGSCTANTTFGCSSDRAPFQTCDPTKYGDWWVSHGTPEVLIQPGGNISAMMWSGRFNLSDGDNRIYGEGLFNYCSTFKAGMSYNLSFIMKNQGLPLTNFFVKLTNGINGPNDYYNPNLYNVDQFYEIPTTLNEQIIFTNPGFSSSIFVSVSLTFTPNADYKYIWFYPFQNATGGGLSYLYIDNVCVNCLDWNDHIHYTLPNILPNYSYANISITAEGQAMVNNGDNVTFVAGQEIIMRDNFTVKGGGDYYAYINSLPKCSLDCATGNH